MKQALLARKSAAVPTATAQAARARSGGLRISEPHDVFEREAERVAEEVMTGRQAGLHWSLSNVSTGTNLQRQCACGGSGAAEGECKECKERKEMVIQRQATGNAGPAAAPPDVPRVLRSPGQPLDPQARTFFESRFGHDFSQVRIHADQPAAASARAVNSLAYTVGRDVVFGAGQYSPHTSGGQRLLAHELVHVVQQSRGVAAGSVPRGTGTLQRKVIFKGTEMPAKDRHAFLKQHKWTNAKLAASIMEEMAGAGDAFDFADEGELKAEIDKRLSTVWHMEESQETVEKIPGDKRAAFGYPFTGASVLYGPRVNFAAREYWEPAVPDNYAVRKDKAKNKELRSKPRQDRCTVYGDQCGSYGWKLSEKGRKDPYHAITLLFTLQPPHRRTLIHCDYLISLVNFRSLADSIGPAEFNKRVAAFGADKLFLKYNAFTDLHLTTFERTSTGELAKTAAGAYVPKKGLGSTQRVRPSSEADLIIGDHVVFFNHLAYDLINEKMGNAWRLENAVLVGKSKGKDLFLGHGSGYLNADEMRGRLAKEFNVVAKKALDLLPKTKSPDKKTQAAAQGELSAKFNSNYFKQVGGEWRAQGIPRLLTEGACPHAIDVKLSEIKPPEVLGPRSPCDPTKMNEVERPIESAK